MVEAIDIAGEIEIAAHVANNNFFIFCFTQSVRFDCILMKFISNGTVMFTVWHFFKNAWHEYLDEVNF